MTGFEVTVICLALNIYKEARGEPLQGQQAVALVTINRARETRKDVCDVVFAPGQFSWVATDTHNGVLIPSKRPDRNSPEWSRSLSIARQAFLMYDFTNSATYFRQAGMNPVKGQTLVGKWGNHEFFKEERK